MYVCICLCMSSSDVSSPQKYEFTNVNFKYFTKSVYNNGTVLWYCIMVLYYGTVLWYCIMVLYYGTVLWYCIMYKFDQDNLGVKIKRKCQQEETYTYVQSDDQMILTDSLPCFIKY